MTGRKGLAGLSRISLGIVLILFWGWMYLRAPQLFPNGEIIQDHIQKLMVFTAFMFSFNALASRKTETSLFEVSFLKAFPKFLIAGAITIAVLFLFGLTLKGGALPTIFTAVSSVGLGVILLHAFFVAILEEKVFRGWLWNELIARGIDKTMVWILVAITFAFFHYLLNGDWTSLIIYIPLSFIFTYVKLKWSPRTDMSNAGVHFGWNFFVLGFLS